MEAAAGYRNAVELYRAHEPQELGVVLLGLAQAEMLMGSFESAEQNLNRAEPLLDGQADSLASLRQARAFIASATGDPSAATKLGEYAQVVDGELHPTHQAEAGKAAAYAQHYDGELPQAKREFDAQIEEARAAGDPKRLSDLLARAATATQDLALATADPPPMPKRCIMRRWRNWPRPAI